MIQVGYWKSTSTGSPWLDIAQMLVSGMPPPPDVRDFVDPSWDPTERDTVLAYVQDQKFRGESWLGYSACRLCAKTDNGSADFDDGVYQWPEGFGHYIKHHSVRPPDHFVGHVLRARRKQ